MGTEKREERLRINGADGLAFVEGFPVRESCGLSDVTPRSISQVPDGRSFNEETLSIRSDTYAAVIINVTITSCAGQQVCAFVAVHGFGGHA